MHSGGARELVVARYVTSPNLMRPYEVLWHSNFQSHGLRFLHPFRIVGPSGYGACPFHYNYTWNIIKNELTSELCEDPEHKWLRCSSGVWLDEVRLLVIVPAIDSAALGPTEGSGGRGCAKSNRLGGGICQDRTELVSRASDVVHVVYEREEQSFSASFIPYQHIRGPGGIFNGSDGELQRLLNFELLALPQPFAVESCAEGGQTSS